jgi:hypothetical protein
MHKTILLILIFIVLFIGIYQHNKNKQELDSLKKQLSENQNNSRLNNNIQTNTPENINIKIIEKQYQPLLANPFKLLRDYDYRALSDPLVPPLKRDDWNIPVIPIPTRGYPTAFKRMGMLIDNGADNNDPYKFLLLIGRQKYPSSNWYEYYAIEKNMSDGSLKFDLPNIRKEIMDGDVIKIKELNKTYSATIDRNLGFEYSPFIY